MSVELQENPAEEASFGLPETPNPVRHRSMGQKITVALMIGSLIVAGLLRQVASGRQEMVMHRRGTPQSRSTFGNMDSFALALLLGGLRGPLVMFLWSSSESQKADRDLEDFNTKVEWIRLLQPEFDTVAIFQIWNLAYNISAMMSSPANKFTVIMEALDYADKFDRERPGDVNILNSISNVYGGKLGSSTLPEFSFYVRQFRQESLTPENCQKAFNVKVNRLDNGSPMLDANNQIRADLIAPDPDRARPANLEGDEWNDGSALQYLKPFAPFPYGISPLALAYNYAKRAEVAVSAEGQKPLQLSAMVIDSRPGVTLKFWAEDETKMAHFAEARAFGLKVVDGSVDPAIDTIRPDQAPADPQALDEAMHYFQQTARIAAAGLTEYERHLKKPDYAMRVSTYHSHIADLKSARALSQADYDYLLGGREKDLEKRTTLLHESSRNYAEAMIELERTALMYFTEDAAFEARSQTNGVGVMPRGLHGKYDVPKLNDNEISEVYDRVTFAAMHMSLNSQQYHDERLQYNGMVQRCRGRIGLIHDVLH